MPKYLIEVDETQLLHIVWALDTYIRLGIGQLETVLEALTRMGVTPPDDDEFLKYQQVRELLRDIKELYGHPANGSHGIYNKDLPESVKRSYDILQVLRFCYADGRPGHEHSVWLRKPLKASKESLSTCIPLPEPDGAA